MFESFERSFYYRNSILGDPDGSQPWSFPALLQFRHIGAVHLDATKLAESGAKLGPWGPGFAGDPLPPPTHRRAEVRCPRVQRGCWAAPLRVGVATPNRSWHSWVILELKLPLKSLFHSWWEDGSLDISGYLMMLTYSFLVNIPFSHPIPVLDHSRSSTPAVEHRPVQRPPRSSRTCPHPGHLWSVEVQGKICEAVADQQIHLAIDSFNIGSAGFLCWMLWEASAWCSLFWIPLFSWKIAGAQRSPLKPSGIPKITISDPVCVLHRLLRLQLHLTRRCIFRIAKAFINKNVTGVWSHDLLSKSTNSIDAMKHMGSDSSVPRPGGTARHSGAVRLGGRP